MQERIQLSQKQLTALIKVRRTLLAHIGALLAEREQMGMRIRVSPSSSALVMAAWMREDTERAVCRSACLYYCSVNPVLLLCESRLLWKSLLCGRHTQQVTHSVFHGQGCFGGQLASHRVHENDNWRTCCCRALRMWRTQRMAPQCTSKSSPSSLIKSEATFRPSMVWTQTSTPE